MLCNIFLWILSISSLYVNYSKTSHIKHHIHFMLISPHFKIRSFIFLLFKWHIIINLLETEGMSLDRNEDMWLNAKLPNVYHM